MAEGVGRKEFECVEEPEVYGTELISVDASFKGDEGSDFVSIQVWGKRAQDYFFAVLPE